ncbi:AMP-dependent synthetase and ligase [Myxococcus stipitatus DSM 14675]|uniref:AMP-dependent synthetase and ligase n=1 Tax=Myxococcus stipitatus (strain DSM 14675 / JCM 12634 / Mx s8) TaxID=1278073 RepID=L7U456_MYXSD|nr:class I adenylate-forming enzyme family protein [Myxococcus stipitatus]AGC42923.1 AMP-dependent synthetase and ligase [Myxococcus stipitatus DSM 14675]
MRTAQAFTRTDASVALQLGGRSLTFESLREAVEARKHRLGVLPPGIAILRAHRSREFIATFLALYEAGAPLAVFATEWTAPETEVRRQLLGRCFELDESFRVSWRSEQTQTCHHPDTALVLFTSGSMGAPRAVQLSRENIEANVVAVRRSLDFDTAPEQTLVLPLSYSFGLLGQLLPALAAGVPTVLLSNLVELKARLEEGALVGMLSGVPSHHETLLRLLGEAPPRTHAVTHVISAGAALDVALRQRLLRAFPRARVYVNYGQTELSPRVLCLRSDHPAFLSQAAGYPVGELTVKQGDDGELWVRGNQVMLGYLGDEGATRGKMEGGWLRTGDLARIDSDGLVTLLGRNDDLLKVGGERLSPLEIEAALRMLPHVEDAAIWGREDALYGTSLTAFLQLPAGAPGVSREALRRALRDQLSPHKVPADFYRVEQLPRSSNGKLQRHRLGELLQPGRRIS